MDDKKFNDENTFERVELNGTIFRYNDSGNIAYRNNVDSRKCVIFYGGLDGNICGPGYIKDLEAFCTENNLCLTIPQFTTHPHFTLFPISKDIEDLKRLLDEIEEKYDEFILIGHSTGCQDTLLFLKEHYCSKIKGAVLQAPVSDVEGQEHFVPDLHKYIEEARTNKFIEFDGIVYASERFLSLYTRHDTEDLFSSWIEDAKYKEFSKYCPIVSFISGADKYCFVSVQDKLKLFGDVIVIDEAGHSIKESEHRTIFINELGKWMRKIGFL